MQINYHTHTSRCMHAQGSDEDFVLAAIENGFSRIGFSDHSPWPFAGYVSGMRMHESELDGYVESVLSLREKYQKDISVLLGLECEYFPRYLPWLCAMIEKHGLDFIILGHHFCGSENGGVYNGSLSRKEDVLRYQEDVCDAMKTGLFSYVAHPDLFMRGYARFDKTCETTARRIIETAIETDTPLEYNLLGIQHGLADGKQGYPHPNFWRLVADYGAKAIIGIDAHQPQSYGNKKLIANAERYLAELDIPVVTEIRTLQG